MSVSGEKLCDLVISDGKFAFKVYNQKELPAFLNALSKKENLGLIVQWEEIISKRKGVLLLQDTKLALNNKID